MHAGYDRYVEEWGATVAPSTLVWHQKSKVRLADSHSILISIMIFSTLVWHQKSKARFVDSHSILISIMIFSTLVSHQKSKVR